MHKGDERNGRDKAYQTIMTDNMYHCSTKQPGESKRFPNMRNRNSRSQNEANYTEYAIGFGFR
jgi:hypothetical protein